VGPIGKKGRSQEIVIEVGKPSKHCREQCTCSVPLTGIDLRKEFCKIKLKKENCAKTGEGYEAKLKEFQFTGES
jgi:hypothetical protein